jgi:hypothetical protein
VCRARAKPLDNWELSVERADHLRTRLAEAEDDLDRLGVAEQVVKEILAEQPGREPAEEPGDESAPVYQLTWKPGSPSRRQADSILR